MPSPDEGVAPVSTNFGIDSGVTIPPHGPPKSPGVAIALESLPGPASSPHP